MDNQLSSSLMNERPVRPKRTLFWHKVGWGTLLVLFVASSTKQQLLICLIAGIAGAIISAVQWRMYTSDVSLQKTFGAHLKDLRRYYAVAIAVMLAISALLTMIHDWLDVLQTGPIAFMLAWFAVVVLQASRFVTTNQRDC